MDAHLFSRFCRAALPRLEGAWLEKIQEPLPGLVCFSLTLPNRKAERKIQLCLCARRKEPFLFLTSRRLTAGKAPGAPVMRLRKYTLGRRIAACVPRFAERQLWLLMGGQSQAAADAPEGKNIWLLLDLRDGPALRFCTPEELERFKRIELITGYIDKAREDGLRLTNLGVFRTYLVRYLRSLPDINKELTCMVRHLQPTEAGIPIEIYCFSSNKIWVEYERIQADIFDHVLAIVTEFGLNVFQNVSGTDIRNAISNRAMTRASQRTQ